MIYDKIVAAVGEVAKEKGYAMVVAQIVPPEPSDDQFDRLTAEQLINLLRQQNLLYVDPASDITADVVTRMDAKYASPAGGGAGAGSGAGGGGATPAPAGTPAPSGR